MVDLVSRFVVDSMHDQHVFAFSKDDRIVLFTEIGVQVERRKDRGVRLPHVERVDVDAVPSIEG
jgi:hypothetical protein